MSRQETYTPVIETHGLGKLSGAMTVPCSKGNNAYSAYAAHHLLSNTCPNVRKVSDVLSSVR
ncbi:MAG: hypothetical protein OXN89_17030 [Bryobacterales bacterium]|nr:hypothetical protein [Bryobacterales bacterium]